jgi:hypothetical protein
VPALTPGVEWELELAGVLGIPHSQLDNMITTRDYHLYAEFYEKHKRFPGQQVGL